LFEIAGPDDWGGDGRMVCHPGHGERSRCIPAATCELGESLRQILIGFSRIAFPIHLADPQAAVLGDRLAVILAGQKTASQGAIGNHAKFLRCRQGQNLDLRLPFRKAVHRLQALHPVPSPGVLDSKGFHNLPGREIAHAGVKNLPGANEMIEGAKGFF